MMIQRYDQFMNRQEIDRLTELTTEIVHEFLKGNTGLLEKYLSESAEVRGPVSGLPLAADGIRSKCLMYMNLEDVLTESFYGEYIDPQTCAVNCRFVTADEEGSVNCRLLNFRWIKADTFVIMKIEGASADMSIFRPDAMLLLNDDSARYYYVPKSDLICAFCCGESICVDIAGYTGQIAAHMTLEELMSRASGEALLLSRNRWLINARHIRVPGRRFVIMDNGEVLHLDTQESSALKRIGHSNAGFRHRRIPFMS